MFLHQLPTKTSTPFLPLPLVLLGLAWGGHWLWCNVTQVTNMAHPAQPSLCRAGPGVRRREAGASPSSALTPSAPRAAPESEGRARAPASGERPEVRSRERARSASPRLPVRAPPPRAADTPGAQHPRTSARSNPARATFPLHPPPPAARPWSPRWLGARTRPPSHLPAQLRITPSRPLRATPRHGGSQQVHPS